MDPNENKKIPDGEFQDLEDDLVELAAKFIASNNERNDIEKEILELRKKLLEKQISEKPESWLKKNLFNLLELKVSILALIIGFMGLPATTPSKLKALKRNEIRIPRTQKNIGKHVHLGDDPPDFDRLINSFGRTIEHSQKLGDVATVSKAHTALQHLRNNTFLSVEQMEVIDSLTTDKTVGDKLVTKYGNVRPAWTDRITLEMFL